MSKEELQKIFAEDEKKPAKPAEEDLFGRAANWGDDSD